MKSTTAFVVSLCLLAAGGMLGLAAAQNPAATPAQAPQPALKEVIAPAIAGVIEGGTKVVLLRDGLSGTEGVIAAPDGSMLFTEQDANRINRVDANDNITTFLDNTNRTIGLAFDRRGR